MHYFSVNPNGEAELVRVILSPGCSARHKEFDFDFQTLEIKARASSGKPGYQISYPVRKIQAGREIDSSGQKFWFDDTFGRLNTEQKGSLPGKIQS